MGIGSNPVIKEMIGQPYINDTMKKYNIQKYSAPTAAQSAVYNMLPQVNTPVNVPTLSELFPYMSQNKFSSMQQGTIPTNNMMGAGRFLGQGMTDMSQAPTNMPSMPQGMMYGYNPQQSALLNALMSPGMSTPQFSFNAPTINK